MYMPSRPVHKNLFWNFQSIQADLCYILIYKQMLEKAFCSNIAPSLSSGNHLFYKAEYNSQIKLEIEAFSAHVYAQ